MNGFFKKRQHPRGCQGRTLPLLLSAALILALTGCGGETAPTPDPHEGMVEVADGMGGSMWVKLYEGLPVSNFASEDFTVEEDKVTYVGTEYEASYGIDVSEHQGAVDWKAVADAGVEFAILRAGYRGWSEGGLFEDSFFAENLRGAQAAGLKLGCYFFSQAVSASEAEEEAQYLLGLLDGAEMELPIFFDWEEIGEEARTDGLDGATLTDCCLAFAAAVREAGYTPGVYFYRQLGYTAYELDRLSGLELWVGALGDGPDFYYAHHLWQYSITGVVPGIGTTVDMDILFRPVPVEQAAPDEYK